MEDKKYKVLICVGIAIFLLIGMVKLSNRKEEGITRGEWIYNLTQSFQITHYDQEEPYFKDVNSDSTYFTNIQAAYEWGMLEKEKHFHEEEVATGEFVALTAMKAIGLYKVQIYLGLMETPSDEEYLELALQKELVSKERLKKGISQEQAIEIILRARDLYYSELWLDDYISTQYQEDVLELKKEDILSINENYTEMLVATDLIEKISHSRNIILPKEIAGQEIARKVKEVNEFGIITLSEPKLEEVITSFVISDIENVTTEDIFEYNRSLGLASTNTLGSYDIYDYNHSILEVKNDGGINYSSTDSGFMVTILSDEGKLEILLTDKSDGSTIVIPTETRIKMDENIEVGISVSNISVGIQFMHDGLEPTYTNIQVGEDISIHGKLALESDLEFKLFEVPIYFGNGTASVKIPFYLLLSAEGEVSLEAGIPTQLTFEYLKGNGFRGNHNANIYIDMEAECTLKSGIRMKPVLQVSILGVLKENILDAEGDICIEGSANVTPRIDSRIKSCIDLSIAAPTISVAFLSDEDNPSLLSNILPSISFDIVDADSAWKKETWHTESYTDGTIHKVMECTYGQLTLSLDPQHQYTLYFTDEFVDKGEYYEVTAKIFDIACIPKETADNLEVGDYYVYDNVTFTLIDKIKCGFCTEDEWIEFVDSPIHEYGDTFLILKDDKDNLYLVDPHGIMIHRPVGGEETSYYQIKYASKIDSKSKSTPLSYIGYKTIGGRTNIVIDDNYVFKIHKEEIIKLSMAQDHSATDYTIKEIVENKIKDYNGLLFSKPKDMLILLHLGEDGFGIKESFQPIGELEEYFGNQAYRDLDGKMYIGLFGE